MEMDFGQKPSKLFKNDVVDPPPRIDPATTTSKRPRSAEDFQENPLQQPPQTRRMMGMGLGFPGVSDASNRSPAVFSSAVASSSTDFAARVSSLVATPPKLIGRDASSSRRVSGSSSSVSKGSGPATSSVPLMADCEEIEIESHDDDKKIIVEAKAQNIGGGFGSTKKKSKSPETEQRAAVAEAEAVGSNGSDGWSYAVEQNEVDEHELGHRLSYLQMRGYSQELLDVMDEGILEEPSEGYSSASELGGHTEQVEQQQLYISVEIPYEQSGAMPAVVTPERL